MKLKSIRYIIFALTIVFFYGFVVKSQTPNRLQSIERKSVTQNVGEKAYLGEKDSPDLVVLYSGDTRGNIDTCG